MLLLFQRKVSVVSTTFEVYTSASVIPSFDSVLKQSNQYLKDALQKNGITANYLLDAELWDTQTNGLVQLEKSSPAKWTDTQYAWFYVIGVTGGCDACFSKINQLDIECWEDEIKNREISEDIVLQIKDCIKSGFYWSFRRSVGQPAIVNLSYGLIAAAFAHLTDGILYSSDSAWDYEMFPAKADQFLQAYFNPLYPVRSYSDWAKQNIKSLLSIPPL